MWRDTASSAGQVLLIVRIFEPALGGEEYVEYITNGEEGWDDIDWIMAHGELISDPAP